jgi:hypothetical protein
VLLWDSAHTDKGKHSKFQKLWLGPYKIASVIGNNSYLLKDMEERLFSYTTNGSHLKHYVEPNDLIDHISNAFCIYFFSVMFIFFCLYN